jgi:hypothetical protein
VASFRLRVGAVLAASVAALHFGDVLAQASSAERAAYMSGLRIDRSMLAGSLAPSPRSAMRLEGNGDSGMQETREVNLVGRGVVLEMPRVGPDGKFQRPRLLIGRQSPELNAWMKEAGLAPERCMLPMFRGRLNRDPETGKAGIAVLMSARCTFY